MLTRQPQSSAVVAGPWRRNLRCAYIPTSKMPFDLSGSGRHVTDTTSTLTTAMSKPGRVWDSAGATAATSCIYMPAESINGIGGVTWLAVVYANTLTNRTIACCDTGIGGTAANGISWRCNSGPLELLSVGVAVVAVGPTIATNTWYVLAVRYQNGNGSSGCAATFAVDGRLTAGTSLDNTLPSSSAGAIPALMAQDNVGTRLWDGRIALFANWDRLFTDSELIEITTNPWKMFVDPADSRTRIIRSAYVAPAAGSGHPTMKRWAGVPGMSQTNSIGRGW